MDTNLWSKASSDSEARSIREFAASRSSANSLSSSWTATWKRLRWFCNTPLRNFPTCVRGNKGVFKLLDSQWLLAPALAFIKGTLLLKLKEEEKKIGLVKNPMWGLIVRQFSINGKVWWCFVLCLCCVGR